MGIFALGPLNNLKMEERHLLQKIPWRREQIPTPVFWPGEFHGLYEVKSLSCVQLFATPWTVACQAPPSMRSSRQGYWSGLPFPSPEDQMSKSYFLIKRLLFLRNRINN